MSNVIYDENIDGGYRQPTETEATTLEILRQAFNSVLQSLDTINPMEGLRGFDCDAVDKAHNAIDRVCLLPRP